MSAGAAFVAASLLLFALPGRATGEGSHVDAGTGSELDAGSADAGSAETPPPRTDAGSPEPPGQASDAGVLPDGGSGRLEAGILADAGGPLVAGTRLDAGSAVGPPSVAAPPESPHLDLTSPTSTRFFGYLKSRLGIDPEVTSVPGQPLEDNVVDLRTWAALGAEATFVETLKLVVEGRFRHRAVEERQPTGQPFLLFNGRAAKASAEFSVGETYLDWYTKYVDFRFGNQVLSMGANAQFAPADVLSPFDLREGVFFNDLADVKLPVPAARARGDLLGFGWTVVYVPFFFPNRFDLWGQNEALIQPYPGMNFQTPPLDRSVQDQDTESLIITQLPKALPQNGDLGLRLTRAIGPVTVGADYAYTREKLPAVVVDPELARFVAEGPQAPFTDPATFLSLSQRYAAGDTLLSGTFPRYQVGEVEASSLVGPVQIDADVGYSPSRLMVDSHLNPVFHPLSSAVVTVADARGTDLTLAISGIAVWVFGIPEGQQLLILDLPGAQVKAHDTFGAGAMALVGYSLVHGRLNLEARGFVDGRQFSRAFGVKGTWRFTDHIHATLGGEFFGGPEDSPFGYFGRADAIYAEVRLDL